MAKKNDQHTPPSHAEIAARAHQIYVEEGCLPGRDLEHWLRAEAALMVQEGNSPAREPQPQISAQRTTAPASKAAPRRGGRKRSAKIQPTA